MTIERLVEDIKVHVGGLPEGDREKALERLRVALWGLSPFKDQPVDCVKWVPLEKVRANDYNPNGVAAKEMQLLRTSILHDGYTQPVVTVHDKETDTYVIVDGFHRYYTMKDTAELQRRTANRLPVVVLDKGVNDLMASTVRHNRARGKHTITGMSNLIFQMLENGWSDSDICNELGMEPTELLRLKHITGFSKLFADTEYRQAWTTRKQIRYAAEHGTVCR